MRYYTVTIQVETEAIGVVGSVKQTNVSEYDVAFLLANLPLAWSLPLSKTLREQGLIPKERP